jgi:surface antigen
MTPHRLCAALLAGALLLAARPAAAVYSCGGYNDSCKCNANNPYPCCSNGGNCTWWAWHSACCNWKVGLPPWGNAKEWAGNAKAHPSYEVKSSPVPNSIAVRVSSSYGHVAWVKSVSGSSITVTEMGCWSWYGMRTHTYSASYFDGGFIVQKTPCACTAGKTETKSCGNCGTRTRTCKSDCQWGSWSACSGEGVCAAGTSASKDCGNCGTRTRTCNSSCEWDSWGDCDGEGVCAPDAIETEPCGSCGEQRTRTCGSDCSWGEWSSCLASDAGSCAPDSGPGTGSDAGLRQVPSSPSDLVGGCRVGSGGLSETGPVLLLLLILVRVSRRRTRRSER